MEHLRKFSYDTNKFGFRECFLDLYGIEKPEKIHEYLPTFDSYQSQNDSNTILHKVFYANFDRVFKKLYISFLSQITDIVKTPFYYQQIPNIRFGFPNMQWLKEFHTDAQYNHPPGELNINLAITTSIGTAALQIEEHPNGRIIPLTQEYGEFTFIDHLSCKHGSIINKEEYTLVSLDFRILPKDKIQENFQKSSVLQGKKFVPGQYFSSNYYE